MKIESLTGFQEVSRAARLHAAEFANQCACWRSPRLDIPEHVIRELRYLEQFHCCLSANYSICHCVISMIWLEKWPVSPMSLVGHEWLSPKLRTGECGCCGTRRIERAYLIMIF